MRIGAQQFVQCAVLVLVAVVPFACVPTPSGPTPPSQPESGPGSAQAVAPDVRTTVAGDGAQKVFIYEPQGGTEVNSAPVIVFLHGYSGINPRLYGGWIRHIVQRGNIVLFPVYQDSLRAPEHYTADALAAVQNAYAVLRSGDHISPDPTKLAMVGHSLGGTIAMNLAAVAHTSGLPRVAALMAANAGDTTSKSDTIPSIQTGNYDQVPAEMLFLGIVGENDTMVGRKTVLGFCDSLPQIPTANREVLELVSDDHGSPVLEADHRAPLALDAAFDSGDRLEAPLGALLLLAGDDFRSGSDQTDAVDYYGYWKWFDALTDAAFNGQNRQYALGNTPEQTSMGFWSDGQTVQPAMRIRPAP